MLKKLLLSAVAALSLTTLVACDDSSSKKAEDANDHIAILNSIDAELKTNGVYIITYQRFGLPRNLKDAELVRVKELLTTFVYRGNKVLSLTADENIIFSDGLKLQIAIENANRLLTQSNSYETYEAKLARIKKEDDRRKLEEEKRQQEIQKLKAEQAADEIMMKSWQNIQKIVSALDLKKVHLRINTSFQNELKEANIRNIERMSAGELVNLEKDLINLNSEAETGMRARSSSNRPGNSNFTDYSKQSSEYLRIVRNRLETLTGASITSPKVSNPNQIGTVEAVNL